MSRTKKKTAQEEKTWPDPRRTALNLNVCIETPIYERLESICKDAGQTETVAVERALALYLDDYEERQKKLREPEHGLGSTGTRSTRVDTPAGLISAPGIQENADTKEYLYDPES